MRLLWRTDNGFYYAVSSHNLSVFIFPKTVVLAYVFSFLSARWMERHRTYLSREHSPVPIIEEFENNGIHSPDHRLAQDLHEKSKADSSYFIPLLALTTSSTGSFH